MEIIISQILLAISPVLVSALTSVLKPAKDIVFLGYRNTVLRFLVALLSFGAIVGTSFLAEKEVDTVSIETFVQTFLVFIGATGTHFWFKYKDVLYRTSSRRV